MRRARWPEAISTGRAGTPNISSVALLVCRPLVHTMFWLVHVQRELRLPSVCILRGLLDSDCSNKIFAASLHRGPCGVKMWAGLPMNRALVTLARAPIAVVHLLQLLAMERAWYQMWGLSKVPRRIFLSELYICQENVFHLEYNASLLESIKYQTIFYFTQFCKSCKLIIHPLYYII